MSDTASFAPRASEAVARFIADSHDGVGFEDALDIARALVGAAQTALDPPGEISELAARALASYPAPLQGAFAAAVAFAAAPETRADAAIIAAATAAAAAGDAAGKTKANLLEAIVVGRELAARLRRALILDPAWDGAAVAAGIGAAAAAAHASLLDADATRHAIGLAATQAAGLGVTELTEAGALACGKAAADALEAALLAKHGFTAASASLEGRRGLAALMASSFDETALCEDLGARWISSS